MCIICEDNFNPDEIIYLDCSECKTVTELPPNLPNLKFLSIYNTSISVVPQYDSLETLYCFNTKVNSLPPLLKLRKLFAQKSCLTFLRDDLYRLEMVNINNTEVDSIPDTFMNLRWLSANHTKLTSISKKMISLEWLSIAHTNIETMPSTMLSLQYLNCNYTAISDINVDGYPMLRKLSCRGCTINPFDFDTGLDVMA